MPICKEPQPEKPNLNKYVPTGAMIYLDKVLANPALPTYVLKIAKELTYSMYVPTGEYFDKLDDVEVLEMNAVIAGIRTEDFINFTYLTPMAELDMYYMTLLTMLLLRGEGVIEIHAGDLVEPLSNLFNLIVLEDLYRSGKVEIFRDNYTLGFNLDRPVAREIPPKDINENIKGT